MTVTLILGGARSGKSQRAEQLAKQSGLPVTYIATAPHIAGDDEWQGRIQEHIKRRPAAWATVEEELELVDAIRGLDGQQQVVFVDCLTLWLSNLLFAERDVEQEVNKLCEVLSQFQGDLILVSNEVGLGLVPGHEIGRIFRDAQGRLNQQVAAIADHVEFMAAGLPMVLKEAKS